VSLRPYLFCAMCIPARTLRPIVSAARISSKREQHCYRFSRLVCEANRCRLRFFTDGNHPRRNASKRSAGLIAAIIRRRNARPREVLASSRRIRSE